MRKKSLIFSLDYLQALKGRLRGNNRHVNKFPFNFSLNVVIILHRTHASTPKNRFCYFRTYGLSSPDGRRR